MVKGIRKNIACLLRNSKLVELAIFIQNKKKIFAISNIKNELNLNK